MTAVTMTRFQAWDVGVPNNATVAFGIRRRRCWADAANDYCLAAMMSDLHR